MTASAVVLLLASLGVALGWIQPRRILRELWHRSPWYSRTVDWETGGPETAGLDRVKLDALRDDLAGRRTNAFLLAREGRIVYEWYAPDWGLDKPHYTASMAKALVASLALLLALGDERMELDAPAWKFIPAWQAHPEKSRITIRHLATHTSGLEGTDPEDEDGWKERFWRERPERWRIAITEVPLRFSAGEGFHYSNPGISALSYAISASLEGAPDPDPRALLHRRILEPLGVPRGAYSISYREAYECDGLPVYFMGGGGKYTARAAARVGQLMLNGGRWGDRQLLPAELVAIATSNAAPPALELPGDHPAPGLGWWSNANGMWRSVPRDAFLGIGHGHQILMVVPSLALVAVRLGFALGDSPGADPSGSIWRGACSSR